TQIASAFHDMGFQVLATGGTAQAIRRMGVAVERLNKVSEGAAQHVHALERPNKVSEGSPPVVDRIEAGEVDLVINTPTGSGARADGYEIRRAAVGRGIPRLTNMSGGDGAAARRCIPRITTMSGASAAQRAIRAARAGESSVISLQELHGRLSETPVE